MFIKKTFPKSINVTDPKGCTIEQETRNCRILNTKVEIHMLVFLYPLPEGGGGILFYLCPSKIFFSVSVDGRNLIFGHKCRIGIPYCG
jgi:hypothetical protein